MLVTFDHAGTLGPAHTLIFKNENFSHVGIDRLTKLLKDNFMKQNHVKPKGRLEFKALLMTSTTPMRPVDIVKTRFFQNMRKKNTDPEIHKIMMQNVLPNVLKTLEDKGGVNVGNDAVVNEWIAGHLELSMTEEQIINTGKAITQNNDEVIELRKKIGTELYMAVSEKKMSEQDLDLMLEIVNNAIAAVEDDKDGHPKIALELASKYLDLFAKSDVEFIKNTLNLININFRNKFFPKEVDA